MDDSEIVFGYAIGFILKNMWYYRYSDKKSGFLQSLLKSIDELTFIRGTWRKTL